MSFGMSHLFYNCLFYKKYLLLVKDMMVAEAT